jgi:hypothetical protein
MRKQTTLFLFFICLKLVCFSQNDMPVKTLPSQIFRSIKKDPSDTASWSWKRGGIVSVNIAQGSLSNWAAGGDNFSLAVTSYLNYHVFNKGPKHSWDNNLDFNFGFIQTTSLGSRKNDDRIDILSKYGIRIDSTNKWYLSGLFNLRSQFFDGYTYSGDQATLSSTFFSPAYLVLSVGVDYRPYDNFSLFMSPLTQRTTILLSERLNKQGLYGVPPFHSYINQIGVFASVNFYKTIWKNLSYRGKLDLFTDYQHNPGNIDVYFTNIINIKVNRFLAVSYSLDMIYDDDVKLFGKNNDSPALQLKSLIGIGFAMPFANVMK